MTFDEYQGEAEQFIQREAPLTAAFPLAMWTIGLLGEAGELAEKVKKSHRDGVDLRGEVLKEAGDVLWYLSVLVSELGGSLEGVAVKNIDKLSSRRDRGVLNGSGDNR